MAAARHHSSECRAPCNWVTTATPYGPSLSSPEDETLLTMGGAKPGPSSPAPVPSTHDASPPLAPLIRNVASEPSLLMRRRPRGDDCGVPFSYSCTASRRRCWSCHVAGRPPCSSGSLSTPWSRQCGRASWSPNICSAADIHDQRSLPLLRLWVAVRSRLDGVGGVLGVDLPCLPIHAGHSRLLVRPGASTTARSTTDNRDQNEPE